MLNNEKNYKFGMFYYNKEDSQRFIKNTRNAGGFNGFGINYAHPIGKFIGFVTALILIGVVIFTFVT